MHLALWKPISHCAAIILEKKKKKTTKNRWKGYPQSSDDEAEKKSTILRRRQEHELREALDESSEAGSLSKFRTSSSPTAAIIERSRSLFRLHAQRDFLRTTALAADRTFAAGEPIPDLHQSFSKFLAMYPNYHSSETIDAIRDEEYSHLNSSKVCLDYCGFGLFSNLQVSDKSSAFTLSEITESFSNHAFYGFSEKGSVEHDIKSRIMDYLNIPEIEYGIVFTVSRGSAFKLLANSYPFETNKKLLTMFDHESQSVNWMARIAKEKGASIQNAWFKWPALTLCSSEMRKQISSKRRKKKGSAAVGLFVFPVQSRATGAKYSYQWMALAQQNNWHVLLDAGSLGPKDMDSLGLSLFRPDFIITSFYRVFGSDPSGFGCLLIKKSVMADLQNQGGGSGSGMVRIIPVYPRYLSYSAESLDGLMMAIEDEEMNEKENTKGGGSSQLPAFSGVFTSAQVRDVFETEMDDNNCSNDRDGVSSSAFEEIENVSVGEVMKSPVFSEDESSDNSFWIDLGQSPVVPGNSGLKKGKLGSPVPPSWFSRRKNHHMLTSKPHLRAWNQAVSFDAAVISASQDLNVVKELLEKKPLDMKVIDEQHHKSKELSGSAVGYQEDPLDIKESVVTRENEGDLRLLERREGKNCRFTLGDSTPMRRLSDDDNEEGDYYENYDGERGQREPEIVCRHLDHVNIMGLNRTTSRLRYLVNWLVTSLLQLTLPDPDGSNCVPLVLIYGPKIKYERGAAVAFNLRSHGGALVKPDMVQKLAERNGICLGLGILSHIRAMEAAPAVASFSGREGGSVSNGRHERKHFPTRMEVVTASLGFLTNFEDVYRMWAFVAKFLDPGFVGSSTDSSALEI